MSTVVLQDSNCSMHPVPGGAWVDDSKRLLKQAAVYSLGLHLTLAAVVFMIATWPKTGIVGTPQEEVLDITIVPLSALDTVLPKGAPEPVQPPQSNPVVAEQPQQEKPTEQSRDKRSHESETPKKIVASKTLTLKDRSALDTTPIRKSDTTPSTVSVQQLGIANGDAVTLEQARVSYQDMVATLLARAKRYPERALKRRMTGEAAIRLEISSDGSLADFQILRSTETPVLDEELRAMVERAAPFPAFPSDLRKNKLALVVPIAFRLKS